MEVLPRFELGSSDSKSDVLANYTIGPIYLYILLIIQFYCIFHLKMPKILFRKKYRRNLWFRRIFRKKILFLKGLSIEKDLKIIKTIITAPIRNRTGDLILTRDTLCQLSHKGKKCSGRVSNPRPWRASKGIKPSHS